MEHDYRDVLLKAASYVEQGWCQEYYQPRNLELGILEGLPQAERRCVVGAIDNAALDLFGASVFSSGGVRSEASTAIAHVLGLELSQSDRSALTRWNDTPGRTADEVAAALREAADA